jgi:hypothetical protein
LGVFLGSFGEFWELGVGKGEREEPCMMALRTLFISCVRKVGEYNKEFFSFFLKKNSVINNQWSVRE